MHMADEMRDVVLRYVKNEYIDEDDEDTEVDYDTPLISGGIVDSFSMVSLKVFLEKKYSIQIPDAKATPEAFDSVNKIVALVKEFKGEA
jgi:acyl carrier protein